MKIIFRNFRPISGVMLAYVGPILLGVCVYIIFSGYAQQLLNPLAQLNDDLDAMIIGQIVMSLGLVIAMVLINIIVYATIIEHKENAGEVTAQSIKYKVGEYFVNYLVSVLVQGLIIGFIVLIAVSTLLISPILFGILYFIGIIIVIWLYNTLQFLGIVRIEEGLGVVDGLSRCFYLIKDNWWSTFGLIILASMLGSTILYSLMMTGMVITGLLGGVLTGGQGIEDSIWYSLGMGLFSILYMIVMTASYLFVAGVRGLKYYDLVERKEASQLFQAIDQIGEKEDTFFANEGDY